MTQNPSEIQENIRRNNRSLHVHPTGALISAINSLELFEEFDAEVASLKEKLEGMFADIPAKNEKKILNGSMYHSNGLCVTPSNTNPILLTPWESETTVEKSEVVPKNIVTHLNTMSHTVHGAQLKLSYNMKVPPSQVFISKKLHKQFKQITAMDQQDVDSLILTNVMGDIYRAARSVLHYLIKMPVFIKVPMISSTKSLLLHSGYYYPNNISLEALDQSYVKGYLKFLAEECNFKLKEGYHHENQLKGTELRFTNYINLEDVDNTETVKEIVSLINKIIAYIDENIKVPEYREVYKALGILEN